MNALDLFKDLEARGVVLRRHGRKLIVDAPAGTLTVLDRDLLSQLKPDLVAILDTGPAPGNLPLDWKGTQKALGKIPQALREANQPTEKPRPEIRKPWNPTPEEEATICRVIEMDQGLPPGSVKLYSPTECQRLESNR